jgi:uncharacterized phage infection (PIP) family protein YhgE
MKFKFTEKEHGITFWLMWIILSIGLIFLYRNYSQFTNLINLFGD